MALVCPDSSEVLLLQYIVGMVNAGNPVLHLYSNDVTPSDSTVIGDLTEVSGSVGYAPITLASANWTTVQASGVSTAVYTNQTFAFSTEATAYGYYVTDTANRLLWLERFPDAPYDLPDGGGVINIRTILGLA